jgi:hypothetical protein
MDDLLSSLRTMSLRKPYKSRTSHNNEDRRLYGYFRCKKCQLAWESGNSWPNKGQKCQKCDIMVLPYEQKELKKREFDEDHIDKTKPHPAELCEKCKELGYSCTSYHRDRS